LISQLFGPKRHREVSSYVALGDSFTAGNGCDPRSRWADLVADGLREENPGLEYVNLARDGADSHEILEQIPGAILARADLVTLVCGANDVILNLRPDIDTFTGRFELMLDRLRRALPGVAILTATYPEGWRLEGIGPRTQERIKDGMRDLNLAIREVSASRVVPCLETVDHPGIQDPANFEPDGLHPSPAGHRHAASEFQRALAKSFSIQTTSPRRQKLWR